MSMAERVAWLLERMEARRASEKARPPTSIGGSVVIDPSFFERPAEPAPQPAQTPVAETAYVDAPVAEAAESIPAAEPALAEPEPALAEAEPALAEAEPALAEAEPAFAAPEVGHALAEAPEPALTPEPLPAAEPGPTVASSMAEPVAPAPQEAPAAEAPKPKKATKKAVAAQEPAALGPAQTQMLGYAGEALAPNFAPVPMPPRANKALVAQLEAFLAAKNGFYAFGGALHVFPSVSDAHMDLARWNAPDLWRDGYEKMILKDWIFFAEDAFGVQFFISKDGVCAFDPESGATEKVGDDLEAWAAYVMTDPDFVSGAPLFAQYQERKGAIPLGHRLIPKLFFALGGEFEVSNLAAKDAVEGMRIRAAFAQAGKNAKNAPGDDEDEEE